MKNVIIILFLFASFIGNSQVKIRADGAMHPWGDFPVAHTNEIKGSIKRVKSLVERNAIPVNMRDTGMLCWVTDSSKFYVLSGGTTNVRWVDLITTGTTVGIANETDPIFSASPAATITDEKIAYWNLVGLMMRIDSARKEMHDTAVAHDKPVITYNPTDFILRNDSLFAVNGGEVDPVYMASIWSGLEDRPAIWDAKVDQSALDDTAAALRALYQKHDTIYFKHNGFSGFGEKLDPIVNLGFIGFVKLADSITVRFYRGDSTFLDLPITIGNGTGSGVSRFSFVNANGISGTVATATTTPTLTLAIDTTKFVTVSRFLDSLSHISGGGGGGGGSGTVTNVSVVNANGVSGTVANPTTTPAITLAIDTTKFLTVNNFKDSLTSIHNSITNITNVIDSSHLDSLIKGNLIYGDTHQNITPKADNSNAYEAIDPVVEGAFVTNAVELADAKTRYTSQATIFSSWKRFSHGVNTSGAGNPVPSSIIPGTPSETQSWAYNSGTNTINSTLNTASFTGLVSPDKYSNYTHTVTLTGHTGATFDDNDYIAVVIAYVEDASDMVTNNAFGLSSGSYPGINTTSATIPNQHTISLIRGRTSLTNFPFPVSFRYAIVYDLGKTDEQILVNGESSGVWNTDNAYGSGRNCDIRVVRSGDLITTTTTDWDDAPSGKGSLRFPLTFDLSSNPLTQKFRGSASIGYGALSQENATWTNIVMNPNTNTIYVLPSGDKYTADITGTYSLDGTGSYYNDWGVRRILHNPITGRTFYIKPDKTIDTIANKAIATDTSSLSTRINANTTAIATKLNITDTANIRIRPVAGTNMTITGTYPNLTFASSGGTGGTLQQTLTAGSTLTQPNTVTNNTFLRFTGAHTRIDTAVIGTGAPKNNGLVTIRHGNSTDNLIAVPTIQGDTATGVRPYGNFRHTIDESFVNSDGQRDAVYQWGYNQDGSGGRLNSNEAEFHTALESHWIANGAPSGQFEYHLQSMAKNGTLNRHLSMNINKADGTATSFWRMDGMQFFPTGSSSTPYFSIGPGGGVTTTGTSAQLSIVNNSGIGSTFSILPSANATSISSTGRGNMSFNIPATFGFSLVDSIGSVVTFQRSQPITTVASGLTVSAAGSAVLNLRTQGSSNNTMAISADGGANGSNYFQIGTGNNAAVLHMDSRTGIAPYRFHVNGDATNAMDIFSTAQVGIGTNNTAPSASSLLTLNSTTKGVLIPRMTKANRDAIASPVQGLMVFVSDNGGYLSYYNAGWFKVSSISDP